MAIQELVAGVYAIPVGGVNAFLVAYNDGLIAIDTGNAGAEEAILEAIAELQKQPQDLNHIVITHWHPDHMGSAAALKAATHATTYAHPFDAPIIRAGGDFDPKSGVPRSFFAAPGLEVPFDHYIQPVKDIAGVEVDYEIDESSTFAFMPDLKIIYAPGHSEGQIVVFLQQHGGVLFAADVCSNVMGLQWSLGYEDLEVGTQTLTKLAKLNFEVAGFGHGEAILNGADVQWREKWTFG